MTDYIYLRRNSEIAILENPAQLRAYTADGWTVIDQDAHRSLWREKALLRCAQAEVAAREEQRQAVKAAWADGCPVCKSVQVVRPKGAPPFCRSCKATADVSSS